MWTDRHRTRHEARLKNMVMEAGLDEVARFLKRADPPARPNARSARRMMAAVAVFRRATLTP
jgi:putative transposase